MHLLFNPVGLVCKLMAACDLLHGVLGFKLVFQSKCLWMDVAACVVHDLIQFLVQKRESYFMDQVFLKNFLGSVLKTIIEIPELLSATAVATADFTSILSQYCQSIKCAFTVVWHSRPFYMFISLTPPTVTINQTRPFFPPLQIKMEKSSLATQDYMNPSYVMLNSDKLEDKSLREVGFWDKLGYP